MDQLSLYRGAVVDADTVNFQSHSSSFGSVPELVMSFLQILSAASDIPATRFLGQAPGGLNATGESDLENYYNAIEAYRKKTVIPTLLKIYEMCGFPEVKDIKFEPLWNRPESEIAQTESSRTQYIIQMVESGVITPDMAFKMLQNHGIIPDDLKYDPSAREQDAELMQHLLTDGSPNDSSSNSFDDEPFDDDPPSRRGNIKFNSENDFNEDEHPRNKDGKFAKGGNGGSGEKGDDKSKYLKPDKSIPKSSLSYDERKTLLNGALGKLAKGEPEATMLGLRSDLEQFEGTNDVTISIGNKKKGLFHIEKDHGKEVIPGVLDAVIDGDILRYVIRNKTVVLKKGNYEALLSLDEHGEKKTWLLSGWDVTVSKEDDKKRKNNQALPDVIDRFSPVNPTQHRAIFSHPILGADNACTQIITRILANVK